MPFPGGGTLFGKRIKIFSLLGFEVSVDISWVAMAALVVWSLSTGFFPHLYKGLSVQTYWTMGAVGALGLFLSIIGHEFCHSVVARRFGIPMNGITLFIFGGVAEMDDEPPGAKAEFFMAIVGPLSSALLAVIFYALHVLGVAGRWSPPVNGLLRYLSMVNGLLAGFNLLPAFPLDGGRIMRSILWKFKNDLPWATDIASRIGSGFGVFFVVWGLFTIVTGNFISGFWYFLIGIFLQRATGMSYQQVQVRKALAGQPVRRFMKKDPVTVSPFVTIQEFVEGYVYAYHFDMFPVVDGGRLVGCVTIADVRSVDRDLWPSETVQGLLRRCSAENTVGPETDAGKVLALMSKTNRSRLIVAKGDRLEGIVTLKDMLGFLALKLELEGE
jgi:Zn-dependent protease